MPLTLTFSQASVSGGTNPHFQLTSGVGKVVGFTIPADGNTSLAFAPNGTFDFKELNFNQNQLSFTVDSAAVFDGQIALVLKAQLANAGDTVQPILTMTGFAADTVMAAWTTSSGDTQQPMYSGRHLTLSDYVLP
jgi:hypothetical protein